MKFFKNAGFLIALSILMLPITIGSIQGAQDATIRLPNPAGYQYQYRERARGQFNRGYYNRNYNYPVYPNYYYSSPYYYDYYYPYDNYNPYDYYYPYSYEYYYY